MASLVVRPPAEAVSAAPVRLAPAPRPAWVRDSVALTGCGLAGAGVALVAGAEWFIGLIVVASGLVIAGTIATGVIRTRRAKLQDQVGKALLPLLGRGGGTVEARMCRWGVGRSDVPRRVVIRYAPGADDHEPGWQGKVVSLVDRRIGAKYRVARHDQRHCRLVLQQRGEADPHDETRLRVERTVTALVPTCSITKLELSADGGPVRIAIRHDAPTKVAAAGYRARVERTLSAVLPGRWRAMWDLEEDTAEFRMRPSFPDTIWLEPVTLDPGKDVLAAYDEVEIPYGRDEDGNAMVWRPAFDPNLMVVGSPGTGKTVLEHTILAGCAQYGWPIWVVDGKAVEFLGWRRWPNVQTVGTNVPEQVAVLEKAHALMERRYQLVVKGLARTSDFEPLLVFVDEFADFRENLLEWYGQIKVKGDPRMPPVLAKIGSIARKGRTARVHLLFATQRPDAAFLGGETRDNFRARISLGRLSPQGAMMMWQDPTTGTTIPRGKRGRAMTINDANEAVEIQTFRVPNPSDPNPADSHESKVLTALRPQSVTHDRLLIRLPEPQPDLDGDDAPAQPTYWDYTNAPWVLAADHPEIDSADPETAIDTAKARELSSPMSLLGLTPNSTPVAITPTTNTPSSVEEPGPPASENCDDFDIFDGYGSETKAPVDQLSIGDLIRVDDGHWAVIDSEPDIDSDDEGQMAISWRDDSDDEGLLLIAADELITARHPQDDDEN